ncbi:MAG: GDP-mannose 4,6-dehydratase [Candidatus Roizmanbacteria bacterium]|nr:GDP-mannose 4,6-dehydratase [Candidatus Roizmanbacteria bacterium]
MKVLITGGAGFIGFHLVKHYLKNNHSVVVIDNYITGSIDNLKEVSSDKNLQIIEADLIDYDFSSLSQFDIVYDLASPASPAVFEKLSFEIFKVNSIGLINLLDFFVKSKSKIFVFASTSEVYGDPKVDPQPETYFGNVHTTGPRSAYDEGKRFAETVIAAYIRKYNIDARIARIFNTFGPFMNKNDGRFISNFINQALENKSITVYGDGKQTRSSCYVSDMVAGLAALGETNNLKGEIINLGNPDERKVIEVAQLIKRLTNSLSEIVFQPIGEDDPKRRCPDITKAKKLLNWQPKIGLEKGLKKTIKYFKNL